VEQKKFVKLIVQVEAFMALNSD